MAVPMLVYTFDSFKDVHSIDVFTSGLMNRLLPVLHKQGVLRHDLGLPHEGDILEAKYMGLCSSPVSKRLRRIGLLFGLGDST